MDLDPASTAHRKPAMTRHRREAVREDVELVRMSDRDRGTARRVDHGDHVRGRDARVGDDHR
jgi:hypothetical protein